MSYHWASEARVLNLVLVKKKLPPRPDGISDAVWGLLNLCWVQIPSERPNIKYVSDQLEALFPTPVGGPRLIHDPILTRNHRRYLRLIMSMRMSLGMPWQVISEHHLVLTSDVMLFICSQLRRSLALSLDVAA